MRKRRPLIIFLLGIGVVIAMSGFAVGLSMTSLDVDLTSLFSSQSGDSNFNIDSYDTKTKGSDKMSLSMSLTNTDSAAAHEANVTVQVLDSGGAVLTETTQPTGSVAGDGSVKLTFDFQQTGLAGDYDSTYIVVEDTA